MDLVQKIGGKVGVQKVRVLKVGEKACVVVCMPSNPCALPIPPKAASLLQEGLVA